MVEVYVHTPISPIVSIYARLEHRIDHLRSTVFAYQRVTLSPFPGAPTIIDALLVAFR